MKHYIVNYKTIPFCIMVLFYFAIFLCMNVLANDLPDIPGKVRAEKKEIFIAAASNLKFAIDDIVQIFEQNNPDITIKMTYGSSGNFFNQILHGAPFDLYFSADLKYPEELRKRFLGDELTVYALGQIVVMAPLVYGIETQKLEWKSLFHPAVNKIAIANPAHAPYGKAAIAFMKGQKIYEKLKGKLVMGENVSQAAQFVVSGAAEVGIVALSTAIKAREYGKVNYWKIPPQAYPPIEQGFIILNTKKKLGLKRLFTDFVKSNEGKSIFIKYGFRIP